jgi:hypothetical protein
MAVDLRLRGFSPSHSAGRQLAPTGLPLDTDRFVELRWHRALDTE